MTPLFHPELVNDPFGDPGVFVDFLHQKRAILLDAGDLSNLPSRKILRLRQVFVSHTHMDHFCGFDRLIRVLLGRQHKLMAVGPAGFIDKVENKLGAYTWNLCERSRSDLSLVVGELDEDGVLATAAFRFQDAFMRLPLSTGRVPNGIIVDDPDYSVRAVHLDHRIPCLAFAVEETKHINVWRNRVVGSGLGTGPWLQDLKEAIINGAPDSHRIVASWKQDGKVQEVARELGELRKLVKVTTGQKLAYVTDIGFTKENVDKVVALASNADLLFIEAPFLHTDADIARERFHLTARQAGEIARLANVRRYELFHFSPRYAGQADKFPGEARNGYEKSVDR